MNPFEPAPEPPRPVADVGGLTLVRIVDLVWYAITALIFVVLPKLHMIDDLRPVFYATSGVGILIGLAMIAVMVPFARSVSGQAAEGAAKAALVLAGVSLLFDVPQAFGVFSGAWNIYVNQALLVAGEICLWLAITRIAPATRHGEAFYALLAANVVIVLLRVILPREALMSGAVGAVLPWVRLAIGSARQLIVIFALRALSGKTTALPLPSPGTAGQRDALIGGLWLAGGLLVSIGSLATSSASGGYVVTFGAIIYGATRLIRGLARS